MTLLPLELRRWRASPRLLLGRVVVLWTGPAALAAPSARLRIDPARIDTLFKDYDNRTTPGCVVGIYGLADLERPTPLTPTTLFDIASISKQFTAASLVLLCSRDVPWESNPSSPPSRTASARSSASCG